MRKLRDATYRVIYFVKAKQFVAVAWNYDEAVLLGTGGSNTYTEAREELTQLTEAHNVALRWFDGEYICKGNLFGTIEPMSSEELTKIYEEKENQNDGAHF